MNYSKVLLLVASFLIVFSSVWARRYRQPMHRGYHLDWCRVFENECGQAAANAFCVSKGHYRANHFNKWNHPGFRTMTIGQNSICNPRHHRCDSFRYIDCRDSFVTFRFPKYRGYRLDWCRVFERECGAPAANAFCRSKGYPRGSLSFNKQNHPGVRTMTIGQNSICDPRHHRCDSFTRIRCRR